MTSVLTPIALVLVVLTPTLTLIGALNAAMLRSGRRSVLPIKLPFYGAGASLFFGAGAVLLAALLQSRVDASDVSTFADIVHARVVEFHCGSSVLAIREQRRLTDRRSTLMNCWTL